MLLSLPCLAAPKAKSGVAGHYQCESLNSGGRAQHCASPAIVLKADGTYTMSKEKGTYKVTGDTVAFSGLQERGPAKLLKDGKLVFQYQRKGKTQTVIYLRRG